MYKCEICGTQYCYPDVAESCEDRKLVDELMAEQGEVVVKTVYLGNEWAGQPLKRVWSVMPVREKRIIPDFTYAGHLHEAQYKIDPEDKQLGDPWLHRLNAGFCCAFGPVHYWSYKGLKAAHWLIPLLVKKKLPPIDDKNWIEIFKAVFDVYGKDTEETRERYNKEFPIDRR